VGGVYFGRGGRELVGGEAGGGGWGGLVPLWWVVGVGGRGGRCTKQRCVCGSGEGFEGGL